MIYFDHAATTPVRKEVLKCMLPWLSCNTGNASSLHSAGKQARAAINQARAYVSELIGAEHANDIIFTSGGTESDNMALSGMAPFLIQSGKRVILTSEMEHHAILNQIPHIDLPIQKRRSAQMELWILAGLRIALIGLMLAWSVLWQLIMKLALSSQSMRLQIFAESMVLFSIRTQFRQLVIWKSMFQMSVLICYR